MCSLIELIGYRYVLFSYIIFYNIEMFENLCEMICFIITIANNTRQICYRKVLKMATFMTRYHIGN